MPDPSSPEAPLPEPPKSRDEPLSIPKVIKQRKYRRRRHHTAVEALDQYFHGNKQEWRARYRELGRRHMKTFSAKRYGFELAQSMASSFMEQLRCTGKVPGNIPLLEGQHSNDASQNWWSNCKIEKQEHIKNEQPDEECDEEMVYGDDEQDEEGEQTESSDDEKRNHPSPISSPTSVGPTALSSLLSIPTPDHISFPSSPLNSPYDNLILPLNATSIESIPYPPSTFHFPPLPPIVGPYNWANPCLFTKANSFPGATPPLLPTVQETSPRRGSFIPSTTLPRKPSIWCDDMLTLLSIPTPDAATFAAVSSEIHKPPPHKRSPVRAVKRVEREIPTSPGLEYSTESFLAGSESVELPEGGEHMLAFGESSEEELSPGGTTPKLRAKPRQINTNALDNMWPPHLHPHNQEWRVRYRYKGAMRLKTISCRHYGVEGAKNIAICFVRRWVASGRPVAQKTKRSKLSVLDLT